MFQNPPFTWGRDTHEVRMFALHPAIHWKATRRVHSLGRANHHVSPTPGTPGKPVVGTRSGSTNRSGRMDWMWCLVFVRVRSKRHEELKTTHDVSLHLSTFRLIC